jgi:maleylpyruvate isomerase
VTARSSTPDAPGPAGTAGTAARSSRANSPAPPGTSPPPDGSPRTSHPPDASPRTSAVRRWMDDGTARFLNAVDGLPDKGFAAPTPLPGWTRAHLVAHVHHNAKALLRLLHWARTGERTPMYASAGQRRAEIEEGALLPVPRLRALVRGSADELAAAVDELPDGAWDNEVVTAQGRTVPAREVLWMRTREVAVHAVDLDAGTGFGDLPAGLNAALAADAARKHATAGEGAALAAWLTGRTAEAPRLGPWL